MPTCAYDDKSANLFKMCIILKIFMIMMLIMLK